ncbi:MAG TPA: SRPBCC domain-containing protein [Acidimicrobiales bacterium]|nr:SRPBCC domain-containing protein [Acidimicrobiales bacterium]
MNTQNFTTSFSVDQTPEETFAAITNVRGWWTGDIEGSTDTVGDEFSYRYPGAHYSKQKITELVANQRVVWRVVDSDLTGPDDPSEWTGTEISFDISRADGRTEVRFSHLGLVPEFECFDSCSSAWGFYVNGSLRRLITTGEGPATPPWA